MQSGKPIRKISMFDDEELRRFPIKADFDFHLNLWYWFKAKTDEKMKQNEMKQNAYCHKINI